MRAGPPKPRRGAARVRWPRSLAWALGAAVALGAVVPPAGAGSGAPTLTRQGAGYTGGSSSASSSLGSTGSPGSRGSLGPPLLLSLGDVVELALTNNPTLRGEGFLALRTAAEVPAADGARDLFFYLKSNYTDSNVPSTSSLTGNNQMVWTGNVGLRQALITGTAYDLSFNNTRTETDFPFNVLDPNYRVDTTLTVTQPLLKGFGLDVNEAPGKIAQHASDAAMLQYRGRAAQVVQAALEGLWDLNLTRALLEVKTQSLARAQQLERTVGEQVDRGLLAKAELLKAQVAAAARDDELVLARKSVRDAEDRLRDTIAPDADPSFWERELVPAGTIDFPARDVDDSTAVSRALEQRVEILQAREDLASRKETVALVRNSLLPSLNLTGGLRVNGLAGTEKQNQSLIDFKDDYPGIYDLLNALFGGLLVGAGTVDRSLVGGYLDAIENMDFLTWTVGVNLEIPLGNDTAESRYIQAVADQKRSEESLKSLSRKVQIEVREIIRRVHSNQERLDTTLLTRQLAEKNLAAEEEKLARGYTSSQEVLDLHVSLAEARANELKARTDLEKSYVAFARSAGTLLELFHVAAPAAPSLGSVDVPGRLW
jgi:outer membrane protein TolC